MSEPGKTAAETDLCVIGAGSAGLSVAAGAAQMGARTVLIEKSKMGGDCLNTGCVPSKSLLASAHAASVFRHGHRLGLASQEPTIDFARVHGHVQGVIASIAPHDSEERFRGLGVDVIRAPARFIDRRTVEAGGRRIRARRFVIATGSRAAVPAIAGLEAVPFLTNETLFDLTLRPSHLAIIGGGPIGVEMAQAFRRLGSSVTVVARHRLLPRDDDDAVAIVRARLQDDGVEIFENTGIARVEQGPTVVLRIGGGETRLDVSHILVAAGRAPNIDDLGLGEAGVATGSQGIVVDAGLRTANRRIYAIGDVAGGLQFTHVASYHAGIVVRNALFRLPARARHATIPWVTYCDPELAHVGLTEADARSTHGAVRVVSAALGDNDRARAERLGDGFLKAVVGRRGRILGCTIVAPHAGDLLQPWVLAVSGKLKIGDLAAMVAPYPTLGEMTKRAAGGYYTPMLFSDRTRAIVRFVQRWL